MPRRQPPRRRPATRRRAGRPPHRRPQRARPPRPPHPGGLRQVSTIPHKSNRDELLGVQQVLEELGGLSKHTFYQWRDAGSLRLVSGSRTASSVCAVETCLIGSRGSVMPRERRHHISGSILETPRVQGPTATLGSALGYRRQGTLRVLIRRRRSQSPSVPSWCAPPAPAKPSTSRPDCRCRYSVAVEHIPCSISRSPTSTTDGHQVLRTLDTMKSRRSRQSFPHLFSTSTTPLRCQACRPLLTAHVLPPPRRDEPITAEQEAALGWLRRASRPVADLGKPLEAARLLERLKVSLRGPPIASGTWDTRRALLHQLTGYGVDLGVLASIRYPAFESELVRSPAASTLGSSSTRSKPVSYWPP